MDDMNAARLEDAGGGRTRGARPTRLTGRNLLAPAVVFAVGLASTVIAGLSYDRVAAERDAQRFESLVAQRVISIDERMSLYVGLLRGVAAYFAVDQTIDRARFSALIRRLRIDEEYPGVQGVGYVSLIEDAAAQATLEEAMRTQGVAGFAVWPDADDRTPESAADTSEALRSAIALLQPEDARNRQAIGFDMASEETRRAAMIRARDRGSATASGRVTLVQETDEDVQPGFLVYLPVYAGGRIPETVEERRRLLEGWVYAPFRARDLFDRALFQGLGGELAFAVYDGVEPTPENLLYRTRDLGEPGRLGFASVERITIADKPWTVVLETAPLFERASPRVFTPFIFLAGLLATGMLTAASVRQARAVDAAEQARTEVEELNHTLEHRVERRTAQLERARARLAELNVDLERAVQARTAELTAANEEIQRFAYIVSHDLRAPLVNVMGFTAELETVRSDVEALLADLAEKAPEIASEDARRAIESDLPEALGFIRASTQKMDRLINAILKLSREGRRVLSAEPVALSEIVEGLRDSLAHQLVERDATIEIGPLPRITSDRLALEQIIGNVVENAVKYLDPARPGRIRVTGQDAGPLVRLAVTDNGRGISQTDFERIFDLFRRAGRQDVPGEGIGLAHTRALVRRLGGSIEVESTAGEGSTFTITLPKVLDDATKASKDENKDQKESVA
ncbi:CHASE domain-containing protein [Salinarimonas chemoclinalis]|uniref:CHASE domain-containing protein n=1 Tax=Salinarimonas chemoclinalis TaxID=3241599 RepID=UPI003556ADD4